MKVRTPSDVRQQAALNGFLADNGGILGFFDGGFLLDVVHSCNNLLNYTIRRRGAGCNPDDVRRRRADAGQLRRGLDEERPRTEPRRESVQLAAVGAFAPADDDHHVGLSRDFDALVLPVAGGGADGGAHVRAVDFPGQRGAELAKFLLDHGGLADHQRLGQIWGSLSTSSRLSTAYFSPSVQPRMPRTSGCSASPTTTRGIPARLASRAMS